MLLRNRTRVLTEILQDLRLNSRLWNVRIHCKGNEIVETSMLLLALSSDYFKRIVIEENLHSCDENGDVYCLDFDSVVIRSLLEYICTGECVCVNYESYTQLRQLIQVLRIGQPSMTTTTTMINTVSTYESLSIPEFEFENDLRIDTGGLITDNIEEYGLDNFSEFSTSLDVQEAILRDLNRHKVFDNLDLNSQTDVTEDRRTKENDDDNYNNNNNYDYDDDDYDDYDYEDDYEDDDDFEDNDDDDFEDDYVSRKKSNADKTIENGDPHTCEYCGKILRDKRCFKNHMKVMHLSIEKKFECHVCHKKFKTKGNLKSHSIVHYTGLKEFVCDTCGFATKTKHSLDLHRETHEKERRHKCDECEKSFAVKTYLTHHKLTAHNDERPYMCPECGSNFKIERQMKSHRKRVHLADKNLQCLLCSFQCASRSKMNLHLIIHSGTKPFFCRNCGETFKHNEEGRRHTKIKHPGMKVDVKFIMNDVILNLSKTAVRKLGYDNSMSF